MHEAVTNYVDYFMHKLTPRERVCRIGLGFAALGLAASAVAGEMDNYRGINNTDCHGSVSYRPDEGTPLDEITASLAKQFDVPKSDLTAIVLHDNPTAFSNDVDANRLVTTSSDTITVPEHCG